MTVALGSGCPVSAGLLAPVSQPPTGRVLVGWDGLGATKHKLKKKNKGGRHFCFGNEDQFGQGPRQCTSWDLMGVSCFVDRR